MSDASKIEWTDATWNPLRGCTRVSEGCRNCYAERMAARYSGPGLAFEGVAEMTEHGPRWTGAVKCLPEKLDEPMKWRKPRRVFVNSMSDLFHPAVPEEFIWQVFAVMAACKQHTFQILTKRPERMAAVLGHPEAPHRFEAACDALAGDKGWCYVESDYPLPNVQLGVSVENQKAADERIPLLVETPAAVRFLSAEPLLGHINLRAYPLRHVCADCGHECWHHERPLDRKENKVCPVCHSPWCADTEPRVIHWVIVGGESGPGARPMHPEWVRSLRDQCQAAGVPFFFKQWGEWCTPSQMPNDLWKPEYDTDKHGDSSDAPYRVGKQKSGRLLDGVLWDQMPEGR